MEIRREDLFARCDACNGTGRADQSWQDRDNRGTARAVLAAAQFATASALS